MSLLYQTLSALLVLMLLPLLAPRIGRHKYRRRILARLGWRLAAHLPPCSDPCAPTLWLHALSVGEVTSALPLVRGLRQAFPRARLVVSTTTRSGGAVAQHLLAAYADAIVAAPLDLGPVVPFFIHTIRPDLCILVETDFWPHWIYCLARRRIPLVLVNGRISAPSFARYHRFSLIFRPMFAAFTLLSMQTGTDASRMRALGIDAAQVVTLGNLKLDTSEAGDDCPDGEAKGSKARYGFHPTAPLWICGSTHRGEERVIFAAYRRLLVTIPDLQLLIAPRNIERSDEIAALGETHGLTCRRWRRDQGSCGPLLILDTIGELAACYSMATVVFVGGSLVAEGGHNPIEPAVAGKPVLFGPQMEDFAEIAAELIGCGGACQVATEEALADMVRHILTDAALGASMGQSARAYVQAHRGVVRSHLDAIAALLPHHRSHR